MKMIKPLSLLLLFTFLFGSSASVSTNDYLRQSPIAIRSNQTERSCSYEVIIKTSCSSVPHTADKISLAFGDAYENEVYAPRIDDPSTRMFERCSTYIFEIRGPCMDLVCHLGLLRNGSDGWKPEKTTIDGPDLKPIAFYFDNFLPNGSWFGINACAGVSSSPFFNFAYL